MHLNSLKFVNVSEKLQTAGNVFKNFSKRFITVYICTNFGIYSTFLSKVIAKSPPKNRVEFWCQLWGNPNYNDINVNWIMKVEKKLECVTQQGNINITK